MAILLCQQCENRTSSESHQVYLNGRVESALVVPAAVMFAAASARLAMASIFQFVELLVPFQVELHCEFYFLIHCRFLSFCYICIVN